MSPEPSDGAVPETGFELVGASLGTIGFYARAAAASPRATAAQVTVGPWSRTERAILSRSVAGLSRPSNASPETISARLRGAIRSVSWK
jgi:hypothetical protein